MKNLRRFLLLISILLITVAMTACGKSEKSNAEIEEDVVKNDYIISIYELKINNFEVEKRQTNQNDKTDYVWVSVTASNGLFEYSSSYEIQYTLYNAGWELEDFFQTTAQATPFEATINQDIADQKISYEFEEYGFIERETDLDNGRDIFYYEATEVDGLIKTNYDVSLTYQFEMGEWNVLELKKDQTAQTWDVDGTWTYEDENCNYEITIYSVDTKNRTVQLEYTIEAQSMSSNSNGIRDIEYSYNSYYQPVLGLYKNGEKPVSDGSGIRYYEIIIFKLTGDELGLEVNNKWLYRQ